MYPILDHSSFSSGQLTFFIVIDSFVNTPKLPFDEKVHLVFNLIYGLSSVDCKECVELRM